MATRLSSWKSPTVVALMILAVGSVQGATYYVSPTGADANPGTQQRPWKTLQKGYGQLRPGDTLILMDGTYREAPFNFDKGGTAAKPIRIEAAVGATVILTYPAAGPKLMDETWDNPIPAKILNDMRCVVYDSVASLEASHLRFRGITFRGFRDELYQKKCASLWAACSGMEVHGSDVAFQQCTFYNNGHDGIGIGGDPPPQNLLLEDCQIHDNGTTYYDHGLYLSSAKGCTLRRNVFEQNQGYAIHAFGGDPHYVTIEDNVFRHNGAGILIEGHNFTLRRNVIAWNARKDDGRDGCIPGGIVCRGPVFANNLIEENTVFANTTELHFDEGPGFGKNNIMRKNTFTSQWINLATDGVSSPHYPYAPVLTNQQALAAWRWKILGKTKDNVQQLQSDFKEYKISAAFGSVTDPQNYMLVFEDNVFQLSTAGADPTPTPPTTPDPSTTPGGPTQPGAPKKPKHSPKPKQPRK